MVKHALITALQLVYCPAWHFFFRAFSARWVGVVWVLRGIYGLSSPRWCDLVGAGGQGAREAWRGGWGAGERAPPARPPAGRGCAGEEAGGRGGGAALRGVRGAGALYAGGLHL